MYCYGSNGLWCDWKFYGSKRAWQSISCSQLVSETVSGEMKVPRALCADGICVFSYAQLVDGYSLLTCDVLVKQEDVNKSSNIVDS